MSRVEETNDIVNAISKSLNKNGPDKRSADSCMSYSLAYMYLINTEIAKSLAQLADDMHDLKELFEKAKGKDSVSVTIEDTRTKDESPCLNCAFCEGPFIGGSGAEYYICHNEDVPRFIITEDDLYEECSSMYSDRSTWKEESNDTD